MTHLLAALRDAQARLEPLHKDSPAQQAATYAELRTMPYAARAALAAKLLPTDALSFREWLRAHQLELAPEEDLGVKMLPTAAQASSPAPAVSPARRGATPAPTPPRTPLRV